MDRNLGTDWRETAPLSITLSVTHMKHQMVQAVALYREDMTARINAEVEAAIKAYDFAGEVRRVADAAIGEAVGSAVRGLIGWELRREIEVSVRQMIVDRLNAPVREDA